MIWTTRFLAEKLSLIWRITVFTCVLFCKWLYCCCGICLQCSQGATRGATSMPVRAQGEGASEIVRVDHGLERWTSKLDPCNWGLPCPRNVPSAYLSSSQLLFMFFSHVWLLATHGLQYNRLSCPSPSPGASQTHVHWVSDTIQPSHPLSAPSPAFSLSQHQGISNESALCIRWPKYWSFIISPSNEYSGLISFRIDSFDLCAVKETLKSLFQHHTSKHQFNLLYGPTLTSVLTTGINIPFTIQTCIGKVMFLLFNMLSRFIITFLPRSKCLLISWLQSLFAVFGAQENNVCHCFHCFPIYLPSSDGTRCHDLHFLNLEL